jgi:hypothetical protein
MSPPRSAARPPRSESTPPHLSQAEQEKRTAYIERNLSIALVGLALFALVMWSA